MEYTKICSKCGRELPIKEFYKDKSRKDGHSCWCKECYKQYYQGNKETIAEQHKQYRQEHKEEKAEYMKQYRQEHKEEIAEYTKQYQQEHKEEMAKYMKQYYQTPFGRASSLANNYRQADKNANRGECTLTPEWIVDNIFTKSCHWCGETDWAKLGCDRIYNDKPHTPDNVNPCCEDCNKKRGRRTYEEFLMYINY